MARDRLQIAQAKLRRFLDHGRHRIATAKIVQVDGQVVATDWNFAALVVLAGAHGELSSVATVVGEARAVGRDQFRLETDAGNARQ